MLGHVHLVESDSFVQSSRFGGGGQVDSIISRRGRNRLPFLIAFQKSHGRMSYY